MNLVPHIQFELPNRILNHQSCVNSSNQEHICKTKQLQVHIEIEWIKRTFWKFLRRNLMLHLNTANSQMFHSILIITKENRTTYVFFICAFSAYRFLANLLALAPSSCTTTKLNKRKRKHQYKTEHQKNGRRGGTVSPIGGHPRPTFRACSDRL